MSIVHNAANLTISDKGFVSADRWRRLEERNEDAAGNGQFVALIEGVTPEEAETWDATHDDEAPGRAIVIDADSYEALSEGVAWVQEHYEVFGVHVETDEPVPTYRVQEGYDGWSYLEVVRSDDETMARWSLAEGAFDRATAERLAAEAIATLEGSTAFSHDERQTLAGFVRGLAGTTRAKARLTQATAEEKAEYAADVALLDRLAAALTVAEA